MNMNILSTKNLNFNYKGKAALNNINLTIPKGLVTGLIGHNGSGKSTLFKVILNELQPASGFLMNKAKRQGFLIENGSFYDHLTALQNLQFNHYVYGTTMDELQNTLELLGLKKEKDVKVSEFSMGMKKRLSIAMAFSSNPDLILLDEPTNELDPNGFDLLKAIIQKWNREFGTSIIYSSHLLSEVVKVCDFLLILKEGKLVFQGFRETLEARTGPLESHSLEYIYNNLNQAHELNTI